MHNYGIMKMQILLITKLGSLWDRTHKKSCMQIRKQRLTIPIAASAAMLSFCSQLSFSLSKSAFKLPRAMNSVITQMFASSKQAPRKSRTFGCRKDLHMTQKYGKTVSNGTLTYIKQCCRQAHLRNTD